MIYASIDEIPPLHQPCGLTIGTFDGVHLGHKLLLKSLKDKLPPSGVVAVFTFSNHPSHHFAPHSPAKLICSPLHKAKLLEESGADIVILTPFTLEFSKSPYDPFLRHLKHKLNFTHLVLGTGATFGKNREGNADNVRALTTPLKFEVEYLPKFTLQGAPLSSGRIRTLIAEGALQEVEACLGRPYSVMGVMGQLSTGAGLYTMNTTGLCLPPEGIYPVRIKTADGGIHLGKAQVLPKEEMIHLEELEGKALLDEQEVEVVFLVM